MMELPLTFGQWVRSRRKSLDMTQEELAGRIGCSLSAIRKIENGDRRPSRQIAALLAEHLRVSETERGQFIRAARGEGDFERLAEPGVTPARPSVEARALMPPARIPTPLTPLVGREHEVSEALRLLAWSQCRMVTLVGAGGIGKTRVAVETMRLAAKDLAELFPDGFFYVPLASIETFEGMIQALADALGFIFQHPEQPGRQLIHYLSGKKLLLGLDNLEHLLEAAGFLSETLQQAAGVKVLVTSRERLNLQAEWVFEVQGLPAPAPDDRLHAEAGTFSHLAEYSAVALFLQTARRVQPDFEMDASNWINILRICQMLEGMPLGIELAAAWVRVLTCREIAEEISRGIDILEARDRFLPERHRSIRAAFDHSWRLLSDSERAVMARLSVFRGQIQREAAQVVAGAGLDGLAALVDQSLLRRSLGGYHLHELVRQYAAARLARDPEEEFRTRERHSAYFLALLERELPALMSARQKETFVRLEACIGNIRLAWEWAAEHQQHEATRRAAEGLYYLTELRGAYLEGVGLFAGATEKLGGWQPGEAQASAGQGLTLAVLTTSEAFFLMRLGRQGQAEPLFNLSIGLLRPWADQGVTEARAALAHALAFLGTAEMHMGLYPQSREHSEEALRLARETGETWYAAYALVVLGLVDHAQGQTAQAYQHFTQSMAYWRRLGDPRGLTLGTGYFGIIANAYGRPREALEMLRECLEMERKEEDSWGIATALNHLGQVELSLEGEDRQAAMAHLAEAIQVYHQMGDTWNMLRAMVRMSSGYHQQGQDEAALSTLQETIRLAWESPVIPVALDAMLEMAVILLARGAPVCARRLLAVVRGHPQCAQETLERANRLWAQAEDEPVNGGTSNFDDMVMRVLAWVGDASEICG